MKYFDWSLQKNEELKQDRNISFEQIVFHIMHGGLLDVIEHPNKGKYPNQRVFVVNVDEYVYLAPFVETDDGIFLKTIIPSRKMSKRYLGGQKK